MNQKNDLYSVGYQQQLKIHHDKHHWGGAVVGKISEIIFFMEVMDVVDVLDYGCGYGYFKKELDTNYSGKYQVFEYDPGIITKSNQPSPANLVICIDVLEHIEPELIDNVLDELERLVNRIGLFAISLIEAKQILPDGRNAHLLIRPKEWWQAELLKRFKILREEGNDKYYKVIVKKNV